MSRPVPRPPKVKLSAEPPVGAGVILVRQTPTGAFAWATGSTATEQASTGTADSDVAAHLFALEAFLDRNDHVGRRLSLDVEDTPAGQAVVSFVAEHLPQIPVTARKDLHTDGGRIFADIWAALSDLLEQQQLPARVIAAVNASPRRKGQLEAGWAWVTTDGGWESGTLRGRKELAVEVLALLRLIVTHPHADTIHIGCSSKQAIATIQHIRAGELGLSGAMKDLNLKHSRYQTMFEKLIAHPAEITFQLIPVNDSQLLTDTASRLAVQACLAAQSGMDNETFTALQASIIEDFRAKLPGN